MHQETLAEYLHRRSNGILDIATFCHWAGVSKRTAYDWYKSPKENYRRRFDTLVAGAYEREVQNYV